jgi:iron complex transport system substrate-binding protein
MKGRCVGSVLLAVGTLVAACTRAPPPPGTVAADRASVGEGGVYPVHLPDDRGVAVTVRAEPQRIVALLPSHTETLFALGLGARVVGVDDSSDWPTEASRLPKLGSLYDARLEALLSLKPDLVLLSESSGAAGPLEKSGLTVWAGSARMFDDIFRVIATIGQLTGRGPEATRLSQRLGDEIATVENSVRGQARVRVYYELDATPYTVGPRSFIGAMLAKAGGEDIVPADLGDFPKISPEAVIAGNPSIILGASLDEIRARPGWDRIAAVRGGRVYKLPTAEAQLIARPGPRIAEGLRALARRLHPEVEP